VSASGYTNELEVPNLLREIAALRKRVEELERRAIRMADGAPPDEGCCVSYCCTEQPGETIEVGEIESFCEVEPDPVGGTGMRLEVSGWVKLTAVDSGLIMMRVWVDVDSVEYVGSPATTQTMSAGDVWTIPFGATIDSGTPDPSVMVRVQNLNTPTIQVVQVYRTLRVGPLDGSSACGEPAGQ
jgi:hypothetical protein